ncbi:MAG: acyl transferase [Bacteroidetes bacterium]|nr:acyl transferase [Bacteroidota bacterium]
MDQKKKRIEQLFRIKNNTEFESLALQIFRYQVAHNEIYKSYIKALKIEIKKISSISEIPFLPIQLFKNHEVVCGKFVPEMIFESSGTTGLNTSKHIISDLSVYQKSFIKSFNKFYGDIGQYCILGLLPSYLERNNSSLVYMVNELIKRSNLPQSGFYRDNYEALISVINSKELSDQPIILIGVSFALLDVVENYKLNNPNIIVMETGGMKGKRKELTREELHQDLKKGFNVNAIHSEYGMTEILSQAYSTGEGIFYTPNWMRILIRDTNDPFCNVDNGISGGINIIDLANINSCSFIMTQDLGRLYNDGSFEVLGRFDSSDIRGCNLLLG